MLTETISWLGGKYFCSTSFRFVRQMSERMFLTYGFLTPLPRQTAKGHLFFIIVTRGTERPFWNMDRRRRADCALPNEQKNAFSLSSLSFFAHRHTLWRRYGQRFPKGGGGGGRPFSSRSPYNAVWVGGPAYHGCGGLRLWQWELVDCWRGSKRRGIMALIKRGGKGDG